MRNDVELPEMLNGNNIGINSQTSSSIILEAIPKALRTFVISLPSSLVCLSLKDNNLSNESFPKDLSSLSMLKELHLDGNAIVSLPNCVRRLPRLEKLSIDHCDRLKTLEHPPCTLKELIFGFTKYKREGKVVLDREMSPLLLNVSEAWGSLVEGLYIYKDMKDVEEEVFHSLGWTNLDFTSIQPVVTSSKVEMAYEFGIFSTAYRGEKIPNWISHRSKGSSISFTIPSSPNNLRGLNFCYVVMTTIKIKFIFMDIKICNITKKHTWIYFCPMVLEPTREGITYLSHWMFGKNEMEDGDEVTAKMTVQRGHEHNITECGVSVVYDDDDGNMGKEDVLGYYKSWNRIIGGDLSPFQTTTPGEYELSRGHFFGDNHHDDYVDNHPLFRAFSQSK